MNRLWFYMCLFMLLLLALPVLAQRGEKPKDVLEGEYAQMVKQCNLTAEQQAALRAKVLTMQTNLSGWDAQHREQMDKLNAEVKGTDKEAAGKARNELQKLQDERKALDAALRKDVESVLTPEQKVTWAAYKVFQASEYEMMAKVLGLSEEQKAKLLAAATAYAAGSIKWEQENGEKAAQLEQQIKEAQAALQEMKVQKAKLAADQAAAATATLTPEQQLAWKAHKLQQSALGKLGRVKLTDEQVAKVKGLCEQAARDIAALPADKSRDAAGIEEKLAQTIRDQVLTEEQRAPKGERGK